MKKFYFVALALLASTTIQAQTTVDLEELPLAATDTFYNGSDLAGTFTSNGAVFNVNFDETYNFWMGGFAYSNKTNDTTPGFTNMYSAYPAKGANGSEIYAINFSGSVNFGGDTISFTNPNGVDLISAEFANTTYAYLSMRDGDGYAKKFGSSTDASGNPDGTNGEDFFYITITGFNNNDEVVDSLHFYLADFRFSDNTKDYILTSWTQADLSTLTGIAYLTFAYHSSDVGQFGINTPAYFALDDLVYKEHSTAKITKNKLPSFSILPNPAINNMSIHGLEGNFAIYNLAGRTVLQFNTFQHNSINVSSLSKGIYVVKSLDFPQSKVHKLVIR